jgi:hypothetical protein
MRWHALSVMVMLCRRNGTMLSLAAFKDVSGPFFPAVSLGGYAALYKLCHLLCHSFFVADAVSSKPSGPCFLAAAAHCVLCAVCRHWASPVGPASDP